MYIIRRQRRKTSCCRIIAKTEEGIVEIKPIYPRIMEIEGPRGEKIIGMAKLTI